MDTFARPRFCEQILLLGGVYGPPEFWLQNLSMRNNANSTWRALMVTAAISAGSPSFGDATSPNLVDLIRPLLSHPDSRVRAWACFSLGQWKDEQSLERIYQMNSDPSNRVRVHAWQAIQAIVGPEQTERPYKVHRSPRGSLLLLSDDNEGNLRILSRLFKARHYRVLTATTEAETVRLALEHRPQAILTDNQKAEDNLSGLNMTWDLCRQPTLRETVLLMLSEDPVESIFLWQGGDYYLSKVNFSPERLVSAVEEYLQR